MPTKETAPRVSPRWRLSPRARKTIMVAHIIASVGLLGEVWVLVALNISATVTSDVELARAAYRLMEILVFAGGMPLSLTALFLGVVLAVTSHWGLIRHYWVFAKLLLLIAVILCGMIFFQPTDLSASLEDGSKSASQQWPQVTVVSIQLVMLIIATTLAVFKPKARIGWTTGRSDVETR